MKKFVIVCMLLVVCLFNLEARKTQYITKDTTKQLNNVDKERKERTIFIADYKIVHTIDYIHKLLIYKNGILVYDHSKAPNSEYTPTLRLDVVGEDINGDNIPEILYDYGPHDYQYIILSLGKKFKIIGNFYFEEGFNDLIIKDIDKNGSKEISGTDRGYRCFWGPCCCSPAPKLIYEYKKGKYSLENKFMRKPRPSNNELQSKIEYYRGLKDDYNGLKKLDYIFGLIFSGNGETAYKFWKAVPTYDWEDIKQKILAKDYGEDIAKMNGWSIK